MGTFKIISACMISGSFLVPSLVQAESKNAKPLKFVGSSATAPTPKTAPISQDETYPDGALIQAYQNEIYQIKQSEEAERKAAKMRDDYEKRKSEAEKEIATRRFKVETLKMKQEQSNAEMNAMTTELNGLDTQLKETQNELVVVEQKASEHGAVSDQVKKDLESTRKKLEDSVENLKSQKEATFKNVNKNSMDVQKMRAEVALVEAEIESLDAQKIELQAQEMQSRAEWMALKLQIDEKNTSRVKYLATLGEARKKLESAQKDYFSAKNEFNAAEKSRAETEARVNAEVKKLDESIYAAQRAKAMAEAEKIRVEAEADKLKAYVAAVKKSNVENNDSMKQAQNEVMVSRLTLETARSELTQEVAGSEKNKFRQDKISSRLRGLASAAESSDMMDGGKPWQVSKACKIQKRQTSNSDVLGEISVGQKLVGVKAYGSWIKILNSSGGAAYVKSDCGQFDN